MQTLKKTTDYIALKKLGKEDAEGLFHTEVSKVKKKPTQFYKKDELPQKYKYNWFLKKETGDGDALREVIAQELFRLVIPNQPKTRLVEQEDGVKETIASKEVSGYRSWENMDKLELNARIKDGTYFGLGEVLIVAMLVNETDLKEANLCLNDKNQIIKLDGDCCFTKLADSSWYKDKKHAITEDDIRELPYIVNYFSNHWLDWIDSSKQTSAQEIIDKELVNLKSFRDEVHRAILKILILPDRLLREFIGHHATSRTEMYVFYNEVLERREQLKQSALKNDSFCQYMLTDTSKKDLKTYLSYLRDFKITGKETLGLPSHEKSIFAQYNRLIQSSKEKLNKHVIMPEKTEYIQNRAVSKEPKVFHGKKAWNSPVTFFGGTIADLGVLDEYMLLRQRKKW